MNSVHPDDRAYLQSQLNDALHRRKNFDVEHRLIRPDGTERVMHGIGDVRFDQTGNPIEMVGTVQDVTECRRIEAKLRFLSESSRILNETIDYDDRIHKMVDVVVAGLADICVVHMQENGHLVTKAVGHGALDDSEIIWRMWETNHALGMRATVGPGHILRTGKPQLVETITDELLRETARDEATFANLRSLEMGSFMAVPMVARGRTIGVLSLIRHKPYKYTTEDLAFAELIACRAAISVDNARLYKEAQDAIHFREDVLAVVSHDLRNPLNIIKGYSELVPDIIAEFPEKNEILEVNEAILRSVSHMERLINDLLDFAKIQSGTLSLDTKPYPVEQLIWNGLESVSYKAKKKAIRIETEIQPGLPMLKCDEDRIRQVFANLIGNAIKFSPEKSVVTLRAELREAEILFSVTDHGPGIRSECLPHLFDRYWQAKETSKQGVGLGLSIAKGSIESHRGRIWAESTFGNGSTFYFTLPLTGPTDHLPSEGPPRLFESQPVQDPAHSSSSPTTRH